MKFSDITEFLTATSAGLPNWAWGAIVGAGGVGGVLINRGMASAPPAPQSGSATGAAQAAPLGGSGYSGSGGVGVPPSPAGGNLQQGGGLPYPKNIHPPVPLPAQPPSARARRV